MFKIFRINRKVLSSIVTKMLLKCFRKILGLKTAKVLVNDAVMYEETNGRIILHLNCDFDLDKDEVLNLIDKKLGEAE